MLSQRSPQHLAEVKRVYQEHFHRSLDADLSSELSGRELSRATALMAGDGIQGQVEALKSATSGYFGTNTKELLSLLESTPPSAMKSLSDRFGAQFGPLDQATLRDEPEGIGLGSDVRGQRCGREGGEGRVPVPHPALMPVPRPATMPRRRPHAPRIPE